MADPLNLEAPANAIGATDSQPGHGKFRVLSEEKTARPQLMCARTESIILSVFAIIILSAVGTLFKAG